MLAMAETSLVKAASWFYVVFFYNRILFNILVQFLTKSFARVTLPSFMSLRPWILMYILYMLHDVM